MTETAKEKVRQTIAFSGTAAVVALAVFAVDTLTEIEGAIAVLYVIALLLAAEAVGRRGLVLLNIGFICLTLLSFLVTHGPEPDAQTFLRLAVAIAALCVTTALLLRADNARAQLMASNKALKESEARYRSIFARTRVALWERDYSRLRSYLMDLKAEGVDDMKRYVTDHPGIVARCMDMISVVAANDAAVALLGKSAKDTQALSLHRFIPTDSDVFVSVLQAIMDDAQHFESTATVINDAGEAKTVLLAIAFPEEAQAYNRVVVSMVDVTQREEARIALAAAQAELGRASKAATLGVLSASLAHDLNQPLGAIVVNSQTLMRWLDRDPPDVESARRSAERILRDGQRASAIIGNARSLLLEAPKKSELIDLNALVVEALTLMEGDLQREHIRVDVTHSPDIPRIMGARIELQQVLINLISNGVHAIAAASPSRRRIAISLDDLHNDSMIVVAVQDSGAGLSAEAKQNLFTPFFTTKTDGMGMGLSICRNSIEAIGGTLEGRDHPEGGAVFEIRLPKRANDVRA